MEAWWHTGRYGLGEVAESSVSGSANNRNREPLGRAWAFETSMPNLSDTLPPAKPHLFYPARAHLLILLKKCYSLLTKIQNEPIGDITTIFSFNLDCMA